jgi:DNA polymerase-3 subunit epsilon
MPVDPKITSLTDLTDLTDQDVAEQEIDKSVAVDILSSADIIVAHNAAFDGPFVDPRLPAIAGKPGACSTAELDWLELGLEACAIAHLVSQCGWLYEGQRAENDILALLYLLSQRLPNGTTILAKLIASSGKQTYRVNAIDAPFDAKDRLKSRGYRRDATMRFCSFFVGPASLDQRDAVARERCGNRSR